MAPVTGVSSGVNNDAFTDDDDEDDDNGEEDNDENDGSRRNKCGGAKMAPVFCR